MDSNNENNVFELCDRLTSKLLEKYYVYKSDEISSIFDTFIIEKFGTSLEQKVKAEIQTIKKINESIEVAELLKKYKEILNKLEKEQPVNAMKKLLSFVEDDNHELTLSISYEELKQTQKSIEEKLKKFGITLFWLKKNGLYEKSIVKNSEHDDSPKRANESLRNYLKRALKGVNSFQQAIKIYINGIATDDVLLYNNLYILRAYLISHRIIPSSYTTNMLYDYIEKVKRNEWS